MKTERIADRAAVILSGMAGYSPALATEPTHQMAAVRAAIELEQMSERQISRRRADAKAESRRDLTPITEPCSIEPGQEEETCQSY